MITMGEILKGQQLNGLPSNVVDNLNELHSKINIIRLAWGKPMRVNDGLRRSSDKPKSGSATSLHYVGGAIDIDDNDTGEFAIWCLNNLKVLQKAGLWMEDPRWTNGCGSWVHLQISAPRSGKRVFVPSSAKPCNAKLWSGVYDKIYDAVI